MPARPSDDEFAAYLAEEYDLQERTRRQNARMNALLRGQPPPADDNGTRRARAVRTRHRWRAGRLQRRDPSRHRPSLQDPQEQGAGVMPRLNIPDAIAQHRAIKPATDAYHALVTEQTEAQAELGAAKRRLPHAREADKRAYASALAADAKSKDPGEQETDKAQRAIRQAERRVAALNVAVADAEAAVHAAITAPHGDLMATLGERITNSQHALTDSLDALDTHLTAFTTAKAHGGVVARLPQRHQLDRQGRLRPRPRTAPAQHGADAPAPRGMWSRPYASCSSHPSHAVRRWPSRGPTPRSSAWSRRSSHRVPPRGAGRLRSGVASSRPTVRVLWGLGHQTHSHRKEAHHGCKKEEHHHYEVPRGRQGPLRHEEVRGQAPEDHRQGDGPQEEVEGIRGRRSTEAKPRGGDPLLLGAHALQCREASHDRVHLVGRFENLLRHRHADLDFLLAYLLIGARLDVCGVVAEQA